MKNNNGCWRNQKNQIDLNLFTLLHIKNHDLHSSINLFQFGVKRAGYLIETKNCWILKRPWESIKNIVALDNVKAGHVVLRNHFGIELCDTGIAKAMDPRAAAVLLVLWKPTMLPGMADYFTNTIRIRSESRDSNNRLGQNRNNKTFPNNCFY